VLPDELDAGVGSLVQVPFHGRPVRGWVLGPTDDVPARVLPVKKLVSPVRFFDESMLELLRWVAQRYVAPLGAVIARSHPPRVASEETPPGVAGGAGLPSVGPVSAAALLEEYRGGRELVAAVRDRDGAFVVRPAPEDEAVLAAELVAACLAGGRRAIVLVPEADPPPATATGLVDAFGDGVVLFAGGDRRARYRRWLDIRAGRYDIVVGTRPAVFAPAPDVGLMLVSRESHAAHREDRSPYYHVRDVAIARSRLAAGVCVLSAICPSAEAFSLGVPLVASARRRWPPVEVVRPGPEGRAPRLVRALGEARRGFLFSAVRGYGVAAVCRSCGSPAACAACGGLLRVEEGVVHCVVCEAAGRCASCGSTRFGIRRGGAERVEEWARRAARVPVRRIGARGRPRLPGPDEILVGGPDAVRDLGVGGLDLVGVLDVDLAERRPGLAARERAVATWMEAIGWARPTGRAIVQASRAGDPAVQALVRGNPGRFATDEAERRRAAGFPVGAPVFRVAGRDGLAAELERFAPITMLVSAFEGQTVCLLALRPDQVGAFGHAVRELAAHDVVTRVEAEPHL
jgi:primosomal protein N' (replication factor Y) (superfamily II helicase)